MWICTRSFKQFIVDRCCFLLYACTKHGMNILREYSAKSLGNKYHYLSLRMMLFCIVSHMSCKWSKPAKFMLKLRNDFGPEKGHMVSEVNFLRQIIFFPKSYTIAIEFCIYIVFKCKRYLKANFFCTEVDLILRSILHWHMLFWNDYIYYYCKKDYCFWNSYTFGWH